MAKASKLRQWDGYTGANLGFNAYHILKVRGDSRVTKGFRQLPKYLCLSRFSQNLTKTKNNCDKLGKRLISAGC
jgi:hypothetical protein